MARRSCTTRSRSYLSPRFVLTTFIISSVSTRRLPSIFTSSTVRFFGKDFSSPLAFASFFVSWAPSPAPFLLAASDSETSASSGAFGALASFGTSFPLSLDVSRAVSLEESFASVDSDFAFNLMSSEDARATAGPAKAESPRDWAHRMPKVIEVRTLRNLSFFVFKIIVT